LHFATPRHPGKLEKDLRLATVAYEVDVVMVSVLEASKESTPVGTFICQQAMSLRLRV